MLIKQRFTAVLKYVNANPKAVNVILTTHSWVVNLSLKLRPHAQGRFTCSKYLVNVTLTASYSIYMPHTLQEQCTCKCCQVMMTNLYNLWFPNRNT